MGSEVFRLNGPKIQLSQALIDLCDAIKSEEETDWNIGEFEQSALSDLIPGAYWALSEWHSGQSSLRYAALCQLGSIFQQGMTSAPTEDMCGEYCAYELVSKYYEQNPTAP